MPTGGYSDLRLQSPVAHRTKCRCNVCSVLPRLLRAAIRASVHGRPGSWAPSSLPGPIRHQRRVNVCENRPCCVPNPTRVRIARGTSYIPRRPADWQRESAAFHSEGIRHRHSSCGSHESCPAILQNARRIGHNSSCECRSKDFRPGLMRTEDDTTRISTVVGKSVRSLEDAATRGPHPNRNREKRL